VTLSTCSYLFEDARYILIGRIAAAWDAQEAAAAGEAALAD